MNPANPFSWLAVDRLFDTLLPDLVIALVFFTALIYAVLSKHFGRQRTAVVMSIALGVALATGLVWWEDQRGWSVRQLGPMAVTLVIVLSAGVVYRAVGRIGGSWAGAGIALSFGMLTARILGLNWPLSPEVIQWIAAVALIVGLLALLVHLHFRRFPIGAVAYFGNTEVADLRDGLDDVRRNRRVARSVWDGFRRLRKDSELLSTHPSDARDTAAQIRRILPAEGWLTERLARLRAKADRVRNGHVQRIDELRHVIRRLPAEARRRAARELTDRYRQLRLDGKLARLEKDVGKNERTITLLTGQAEAALARRDYRRLTKLLESAERLQGKNARIFGAIDHIEQRLAKIARRVAQEAAGGSGE